MPRFLLCEANLNYILSIVDRKEMKHALEEPIPKELFDFYDTVLENLIKVSIDSHRMVFTVLSWIYHAKRPLQMSELQDALALCQGDVDVDEDV